mgnify:CR=1 FL=1
MCIVQWIFLCLLLYYIFFFFQAEDGIRDLVRSRGLGDVYKRQPGDQRERTTDVPIPEVRVPEDVAIDVDGHQVQEALSLIHI